MIGLKRGTVKLLPHNPEWDNLFREEKSKILATLRDLVLDIQHVGSTAIPTIHAKPIIDIAVLVKSLDKVKKYTRDIEALDYVQKQENRPERLFFTKGPEDKRIVYLHIGDRGTNYITDMIEFRDHLLQNPTKAKEYEKLKQELGEKFPNNRESYSAAKEQFIKDIIKESKKNRE